MAESPERSPSIASALAAEPSLIGATIARFRILAELGNGGMSTVWLAEDMTLGRKVAVKILHAATAAVPLARSRFLREARAASLLDHPCIVTIYEAGEDAGRPYIAMALVDGETLEQRLSQGPVAIEQALRWTECAAGGLAHAHARGVLHRDISPRNIMVRTDDRIVLLDFGLAQAAGEARLTPRGQTLGTYGYIAPELIVGKAADPRSDLYSLGVILYELLTRHLPFRPQAPAAYMHAVLHEPMEDPRRFRREIPASLAELLERALAREPRKRFQHAEDFAAAVRRESQRFVVAVGNNLPTPWPGTGEGRRPSNGIAHFVPAPDPAAHEHYLQALALLRRPDREADLAEAIRILRRLLISERGPASIHAALARAYLYRARLQNDADAEERAGREVERAVARDPQLTEVLLAQADLLRARSRHAEAIAAYHHALDLRHDLVEAWVGLAYSCEALGQGDAAEDACRNAISVAPGDWRGYARLAGLYFDRGEFARALDPWRRVVDAVPDHARAWWNLGRAYFELDRLEDAIEAFRRSLAIHPSALGHLNHATALYFTGRTSEALSEFETAVALAPGDPRTWGSLGCAALQVPGSEERGREALDRAIALMQAEQERHPDDPRGEAWLAFWLSLRGRVAEAQAALAHAVSTGSNHLHVLLLAGCTHVALGEPEGALWYFELAVQRGTGIETLRRDPFLARLREHPGWAQVEQAARDRTD